MTINFFKSHLNCKLSYAQERIVDFLEVHDEVTGAELYKLSSKKSDPLKQLLDKGVVIKNEDGKYQLKSDMLHDMTHGHVLNVVTLKMRKVKNEFFD